MNRIHKTNKNNGGPRRLQGALGSHRRLQETRPETTRGPDPRGGQSSDWYMRMVHRP